MSLASLEGIDDLMFQLAEGSGAFLIVPGLVYGVPPAADVVDFPINCPSVKLSPNSRRASWIAVVTMPVSGPCWTAVDRTTSELR